MKSLEQLCDEIEVFDSQLKQLDMIDQYRIALEQHKEKERDLSPKHKRLGQERDQIRPRLQRAEETMDAWARYALHRLDTGSMVPSKETHERCMSGVESFQLRH